MTHIKYGDHHTIRQTAKLKWLPNILVIQYVVTGPYIWVPAVIESHALPEVVQYTDPHITLN